MTETHAVPAAEDLPLSPPPGCPFAVDETLGRWRAEEPVKRVRLPDNSEAWLLTRYDDIREMLNLPATSASMKTPGFPASGSPGRRARTISETMLRKDAPDHTRIRRLVVKEFMPKAVAPLRDYLNEMAHRLCRQFAEVGPGADFHTLVSSPLTSQMINQLLDVPSPDVDRIMEVVRTITSLTEADDVIERSMEEFEAYFEEMIEYKRRNPGNDTLSRLVRHHDSDEVLTDAELVSLVWLLISAGYDTTANSITLSVILLAENPHQVRQLRSDPGLYPNAVEEFLRYTTVSRTGLRRVLKPDAEEHLRHGVRMCPGEGVIPFILAGNRDPEMFPDPDELDLTRENARKHLTFGHGPHQCLGQHLAREEMLAVLPRVVEDFEGLRLAVPLEELDFKIDSAVYGSYSLPLTWDGYNGQ